MRSASLPWYDLDEVRPAHDRLWSAVAKHLRAAGVPHVPGALNRAHRYETGWTEPRLLLSQACGYDTVLQAPPPVQLVSTPHFDFAGCDGPNYRSFVVVRERAAAQDLEGLRGSRCVINTETSHSGMNGLRALIAPLHEDGRFFASVAVSGAHETSVDMVRSGAADVAAVDCITHGLLRRHRPQALVGTRVIAQTAPAPAPPFVTAASTSHTVVGALRAALGSAIEGLEAPGAAALGLRGLSHLSQADYEPIAALARQADASGYHELGGTPVAAAQSAPRGTEDQEQAESA